MKSYLARTLNRIFPAVSSSNLIYALTALFLGIALQLQVTLFKEGGYLGLRMNAADLLLPCLGILILYRLLTGKDRLPQWRIQGIYIWLALLTTIMTVALIQGYYTTGAWNMWAIVNKYIGWYVLLAYLGLGGWIGQKPQAEWMPAIIYGFLWFWFFILIIMLVRMVIIDLQGNTHQILLSYPLAGFMGNRNAYAFLSFSMLALITSLQLRKPKNPSWFFYLIWASMPLFYAYNASRAGLVILIFLIVAFSVTNFRFALRHIYTAFLFGAALALVFFYFHDSYAIQITRGHIKDSSQLIELGQLTPEEAQEKLNYVGDKVRMHTYTDAFEVWQNHPLIGGGLGSFRDYQTDKRGKYSDVVDCTGLWLLAETGAIGLLLFSAFFLFALWNIFTKIRLGEDPYGLYLGILLMMMVFGIMSLVHELMYTRFFWFFMGLGLALSPAERLKTHPDG